MNIQEAIKILECFNPVDCGMIDSQAIETLLIAYEKEKEKNKRFEDVINNREYTWKQKYEETFNYVTDEFITKIK